MSLYEAMKIDADETVLFDYGVFQARCRFAGRDNKKLQEAMHRATKPISRALAADAVPEEKMSRILAEAFANHVVTEFYVLHDGKMTRGVETPDGDLVEDTPKNMADMFVALPNVFWKIHADASDFDLFKSSLTALSEHDLKNS